MEKLYMSKLKNLNNKYQEALELVEYVAQLHVGKREYKESNLYSKIKLLQELIDLAIDNGIIKDIEIKEPNVLDEQFSKSLEMLDKLGVKK